MDVQTAATYFSFQLGTLTNSLWKLVMWLIIYARSYASISGVIIHGDL